MAGTGKQSPSPDEIDDNFLLCGICSERYRNAKLLLCLHSFCKPCLDKLSEKSGAITCPVCRRSHDLPGDGVAGIPNNDFLNDLVKRRSEQEQQKCDDLKKCGACEEGEVSNHCLDCSFDICDNCAKAHAKIRSTQSHRLVALDEYAALTAKCGDPCSFQPTVYCVTHPDHRIEFYCSTCDQVICSKCAALDHLKPVHQYMFIKDASQDFTGHLSIVIDKVKVKDVEIQDSKVAIQGTLESLDRCYQREDENVQGHIRDTIEKITRLVEESGNKVQAELKSECEKRKTNLRAQLKELDIAEDDLTGAREFLENLMNHGNSLQLMSVKKRVFDQTETLLQAETRVDPVADDFMAFQACDDFCRDEKIGTMMFQNQECNQVDVAPLTEHATPADIPADNVKYEENEKTLLYNTETQCVESTRNREPVILASEPRQKIAPRLKFYSERVSPNELRRFDEPWPTPLAKCVCASRYLPLRQRRLCHDDLTKPSRPNDEPGQEKGQSGIAMMKNGDALICHYGNNRLKSFTVYGQHRRLFQNTDNFCLKDATISTDGNIFCTEDGSKQVFVCDEKGKHIRRFGKGKILSPCGIAISPDSGILYIVDRRAHCVHVYDQDGNRLKLFGSHGRQAGQLNHPTFVCIDSSGNVYVSDSNNHRINVYDGDGNFLYNFGSHGSGRDQLDNPQGVAVDKNGRVYVADNNNNRLLQFTGDGTFISRVDDPQGGLKSPTGVCVTDDDLLMVSDCDNSCVRVFALNQ